MKQQIKSINNNRTDFLVPVLTINTESVGQGAREHEAGRSVCQQHAQLDRIHMGRDQPASIQD